MKHDHCETQLNVRLPSSLRAEIDRAAANSDRTAGYVARKVLERWAAEHSPLEAA